MCVYNYVFVRVSLFVCFNCFLVCKKKKKQTKNKTKNLKSKGINKKFAFMIGPVPVFLEAIARPVVGLQVGYTAAFTFNAGLLLILVL